MSEKISIYVTANDIKYGARNSPHFCPVAQALERVTGDRWVVKCGMAVTDTKKICLPLKVVNFYTLFDRHIDDRVRPFRAVLEVKSR